MELEEGIYVRTKNKGICKIEGFASTLTDDYIENEKGSLIPKDEITKASHNIMELIEVGDYVNGSKVNIIENEFIYFDTGHSIHYEYIETIVTKEQFEAIQYKVV